MDSEGSPFVQNRPWTGFSRALLREIRSRPRFGSKGVPIRSSPVVVLSRWKEKTARQSPDSQPDSPDSQSQPERARQTESRQTERFPVRQRRTAPRRPGGPDGRPAWLSCSLMARKEGRKGRHGRRALRCGLSAGAPRAARSAASELQRGLVDPVRDPLGGTGKQL